MTKTSKFIHNWHAVLEAHNQKLDSLYRTQLWNPEALRLGSQELEKEINHVESLYLASERELNRFIAGRTVWFSLALRLVFFVPALFRASLIRRIKTHRKALFWTYQELQIRQECAEAWKLHTAMNNWFELETELA